MILNDKQIRELCQDENGMLWPFEGIQKGKPSYGLGSFGYDLRLGSNFLIPTGTPQLLDPLNRKDGQFFPAEYKDFYDLPPHSFVLAESVERFNMPADVCALVDGKSTFARLGIIVNCTAVEPEWKGILTVEIANVGHSPVRLHVGQGIAQAIFFRGERPDRTYIEKEAGGAYQNQAGVTAAR
jgi:dCTP deaminase